MTSRPTVLLFDIDGTLITTGGVGRRALERAFETHFGRSDACQFRLDGMTDRRIFRQGLEALGEEATPALLDALMALYLKLLEEEVEKASSERYRVHPGMPEAIAQAKQHRNVALGLGTGNLKEGARIKLAKVDLFHHFDFGGFGCDHEDRNRLIEVGAERGATRLGLPRSACRLVVIGDTPKDVAAAMAIGAESVGVGTGSFSPEQLLESGATFAFAHLDSPQAQAALFNG